MNQFEKFYDPVPVECVLALWLANHPDQSVLHGDTYFVWDSQKRCFLYCKPRNATRNGWYKARGMDQWLNVALKRIGE